MYQSWQWPAVAATSITDTTALAAGNTTTVTSVPATTWPVQAFNQYAMANMQQQQWAWSQAQGSYPYATGMATQAAYVTPDAYPATTVQSAVPTTEAPKTGQSAPTTTTTTTAAQEEKKTAKSKEEDLTVKDPTELEKLNQLRAQAQQWTSQQTASWPYSTAATASVASSNVALATPWPQGAWNPAAWPQGQWNQQWPQQNWTQQSQSQQADLSVTVATATPSDSEKTDGADPPKEIEGLEDLDKEEQEFDKQFKDCEQQFEEWKKQNMNHPDKDAFARYEKQWQSWRDEQLQKKEEMQKERAKRIAAAKSATATTAAEIAQKPSSLNSPASATGLNQQNPNPKQDLGSANQAAVEDSNRSNFSQGQLATQPYPYPQQFMGPSGMPVMPPSCLPGMFPPTMLRGPPPGMPMIPPTGLLGPPPVIPGAPRPGLAGAPHPGGAPPGLLAAPPPNIPASAPSGGSGAPLMTPQQNSSQPQNQFDHQPGPYDNQRQPPFENQRQPPFESRQPPFENQRQPPFENQQRQNQYDNQQQKQQSFQRQPPFPNQQRPHPNQQMPGNMEGPMSEFNPSGMRNRGPGGMQRNEFQCKEGLLGNEPAGDFMPGGKMRGDPFGNSDPYIEHEGEWPGRMHQDMPFSRGRGRGRPGRGRGQPGGPRWEMGGGGREDMPNRRFDRFGDDPKCGGAESSEFDPDTGMISTKFPPDQPNEDEFSDQPFLDGSGGGRFPPGDFQGGQGPPFENNPSGPCPPFKNERRPLLSFEGECGLPFGNKNECGPPFGNKNECGPPFGNKNECGPPFGNKNECGPPFGNKNECGPPFGNKNECGPPFGNKNECGPPFGNKNERGPPFGNKNERGPLIPFEGEQGMPPPFANENMQPPFNRERGPHPFDEQGPHPFDNERGLLPFDNDQRPGFDAEQGPRPFDRDQGPRPFNDERGPRLPFDDDRGPWPPFNNERGPWLNNERRPFDNEQFSSDMGRMNQDRFGPDERERFFRGNRFGPGRFDDDFPQQGMFPEDRFAFEEGPPHMMSDEFSNRRFPPQMRRFPQDLMRNDMEGPFDFPPEERFGCDFPDGEGPRFPPRFRGDHFRDQPQLPPPGFRGEVIDYIHRPAASVVGNDFSMMYDAFDQEFSTNLLNYRDSAYMGEIPPPPSPIIFSQVDVEAFDYSHGSKPVVTSTVKAKNAEKDVKTPFSNKAIFDYAHRRERNRSPFRDRHLKDHDNNRLERPPRDSFRERDRERCRDRDRNRDRDRDSDRDKERDSDRDRDRRDRNDRGDRDRERFRDKDRDLKRGRDWDRCRDSSKDKDDSDRNKRSRWDREKSPEKKRESESSRKHNGERNRDETPVSSDSNAIALPQDESLKKEVTEIASLKDLLFPPTRFTRPKQLVIILRGLPGSGKTYVAKLIKDKELEHGGCAPRILSLDDYFMVETEVTETDPETGKKVKKKEFQFEYEDCMEEAYRASLFKSFKKTVDDRFFPFIIVDAVHEESKQYEQLWSYAKQRGFQVYIAEMDCKDPVICHKRNVHKRSIGEINKILKKWESKPRHFMSVDIRPLLQDVAITEVEMEDSVVSSEFVDKKEEPTKKQEKEDDDDEKEESSMFSHVPSRWEKLETTEEKLDQLDGLRTSKKKHSTMEDYLQLPDDYEERKCEPGKKRVRWADLEERKEQDRLRAIGFVVGQTDWSKMTDPSHADRALTRTKYF